MESFRVHNKDTNGALEYFHNFVQSGYLTPQVSFTDSDTSPRRVSDKLEKKTAHLLPGGSGSIVLLEFFHCLASRVLWQMSQW